MNNLLRIFEVELACGDGGTVLEIEAKDEVQARREALKIAHSPDFKCWDDGVLKVESVRERGPAGSGWADQDDDYQAADDYSEYLSGLEDVCMDDDFYS